jgi:hypothetical protein
MREELQLVGGAVLWGALGGAIWAAIVIGANELDKWISRRRRAKHR